MIGGKNSASHRPTALGSMLQAAVYGHTVPIVIGTTISPLLPINAFNLRVGKSGKKGKKGKKGPPTYVENIEILIASNPVLNLLQFWNNGSRYPLNFVTVDIESTIDGSVFPYANTIDDPNFYAIVGMTFIYRVGSFPFSPTGIFNDYGGPGPVPYDMNGEEIPMWNAWQVGPDPTNESGYRFFPYTYRWNPTFGNTFYLDADVGLNPVLTGTLRVYYAQLSAALKHKSPLAQARLTFEAQLGTGPEFDDLPSQRIISPEHAGCGSPDIDLGASGMIPSLVPETQGSYTTYARGDADFTDMMETVIRSGILHTGYQLGEIHRGVNCNEYPGPIQKKFYYQGEPGERALHSDYYVTRGNTLLVYARKRGGGGQGISSTPPLDWTSVYAGEPDGSINVWSAVPDFTDLIDIELSGYDFDGAIDFFEIPSGGLDTIDSVQMFTDVSVTPTGSITTTNDPGTPAYVMAFFSAGLGIDRRRLFVPRWNELIPSTRTNYVDAYSKTVNYPGPVQFQAKNVFLGDSRWTVFMIAFKNSGPQPHSKNLGNILDPASIDLVRNQCRAGGLWGSVDMDSQREALDWLADFGKCANAAYVWGGDRLKVLPWSERSQVGNGAKYDAPTASGPIADLEVRHFIGSPPVTIKESAQVGNDDKEDAPNILQIEHLDRNSDYHQCVTMEPDAASVALYGPRKAAPQTLHMIQDPLIARKILRIQVRRNAYIRDTYAFKLKAQFIFLEPMDLVTLTEPLLGLSKFPVRITSISENKQFELECEAEPFIYGVHAPDDGLTATAPQPNDTFQNLNNDAGSVNAPIIFEPVPRLGVTILPNIWFVLSSSSPNYGGCQIYVSTDGGASYNQLGSVLGNSVTGVLTEDWPAGLDPDTVNDLVLDLTESNGELLSYAVADEDNFTYPCFVGQGSDCVPYELMTYAVAQLTAGGQYTLKATGGGTNHLRRAVYGAPDVFGRGNTHIAGSRFAFLGPINTGSQKAPNTSSVPGIFKTLLDASWIGKTLYFKFPTFNTFGGGLQDLADCVPYSYVVGGCPSAPANPNANNYTVSGGALRQSCSSPTTVTMDQATVAFPTNSVNYNARTFTIPTVTIPTTFYVTIHDAAYVGDTGALTNLDAFIETSTAKVGKPGFIYIGSITALPAGCGTQTGPGGLPNFISALQAQPTKSIALAPGAVGNFSIPHGLGVTPAYVLIVNQDSAIWLQSPTSFDSTNIFLTSDDPTATAIALVFVTPADAEISVAPGAVGPFSVAHGLGATPLMALVEMLSDGKIRWQSTPWDGTNLYLVALDAGVSAKVQVMKAQPVLHPVKFARIPLNPGAVGPFTVPHGMGAVPLGIVIRMSSDAEIWPQSPGSDSTNLLLISSDPAATGEAEVWG